MGKLFSLVCAVLLLFCTATGVAGDELRAVGQPMPDMAKFITENHVSTVQRVTPYEDGRVLLTLNMYRMTEQGSIFVGVLAFMKCPGTDGSTEPFGVLLMMSRDEGVLLLDNAPTDGIIDEVVVNPVNRKILSDMPTCS